MNCGQGPNARQTSSTHHVLRFLHQLAAAFPFGVIHAWRYTTFFSTIGRFSSTRVKLSEARSSDV
ncbi:hypothetical protein bAD24_III03425 [Burkholderia sp. AD24]|nr:hypothetical protein bAD24_III03425 [Burkholderia sp. AD24]